MSAGAAPRWWTYTVGSKGAWRCRVYERALDEVAIAHCYAEKLSLCRIQCLRRLAAALRVRSVPCAHSVITCCEGGVC